MNGNGQQWPSRWRPGADSKEAMSPTAPPRKSRSKSRGRGGGGGGGGGGWNGEYPRVIDNRNGKRGRPVSTETDLLAYLKTAESEKDWGRVHTLCTSLIDHRPLPSYLIQRAWAKVKMRGDGQMRRWNLRQALLDLDRAWDNSKDLKDRVSVHEVKAKIFRESRQSDNERKELEKWINTDPNDSLPKKLLNQSNFKRNSKSPSPSPPHSRRSRSRNRHSRSRSRSRSHRKQQSRSRSSSKSRKPSRSNSHPTSKPTPRKPINTANANNGTNSFASSSSSSSGAVNYAKKNESKSMERSPDKSIPKANTSHHSNNSNTLNGKNATSAAPASPVTVPTTPIAVAAPITSALSESSASASSLSSSSSSSSAATVEVEVLEREWGAEEVAGWVVRRFGSGYSCYVKSIEKSDCTGAVLLDLVNDEYKDRLAVIQSLGITNPIHQRRILQVLNLS